MIRSNLWMPRSIFMKFSDLMPTKKFCLVAFMSSFPAMYYRRGFREIVLYSLFGMIVLALTKSRLKNMKREWITLAFAISFSFWIITNFRLLLSMKFEVATFVWVSWIWLVCFVFLRPRADLKIFRTVATNFIVFLSLFSLVEAPFHFADISRKQPEDEFGFVRLDEKSFYQKAYQDALNNKIEMHAGEEYGEVLAKISSVDGLVSLEDFDGDYINIENGRRVTTGSNGLRQRRVLVFGGSTIFCAEVPDSMTIPSQLQKLVLENDYEFDVINYGISGIRIENQFAILKTVIDLGVDDKVVFYDGVNDLDRIYTDALAQRYQEPPWRQIGRVANEAENRSWLIRYLSPSSYIERPGVKQEFLDSEARQKVTDNWFAFDKLAKEYVEGKGAKFIHILQPNLLTYKEGSNVSGVRKRWSDMQTIEQYFAEYVTPSSQIISFRNTLDSLDKTPFVDWSHIDEIGNKKIAEEMFATLEPLLGAKK
jgi:hypothetical protein